MRTPELFEAKFPAPLAQWVGAYDVVEQKKVFDAMRGVQEPDGARRKAIVEPTDAKQLPPSGEPDAREGVLTSYEPDAITFTIDAPRAGLVVLNEIMFPGWEVEVDGADKTPVRANYLMRAVWVDAGKHTITWTFNPRRWRVLVGCYVLALAIMAGAAGSVLLRRRRSGSP